MSQQDTREQLAEEAGYGARHIQAIENDRQFPSVELLVWLAQKFELSLDQYVFLIRYYIVFPKLLKDSAQRMNDTWYLAKLKACKAA